MARTLGTVGISVDTRDFHDFARDLRAADPVLSDELKAKLKDAGNLVADAARANAGYSKKIPGTIKVHVSGATVSVMAGNAAVPLAGLEELGNAGSSGGGVFRHPVFGRWDNWVHQPMHPYLAPAMKEAGSAAVEKIAEALDEAVRTATGG